MYLFRTIRRSFPVGLALLGLFACEFPGSGSHGGSGGKRVPASLTWLSTTLARPSPLAHRASGPHAQVSGRPAALEPSVVDTGDTYLSYRITPANMEGRLIQVGLLVGQPGPGGGSRLGLVGPEHGFSGRSIANADALPLFNMAEKLSLAADFSCCWSTYPEDSRAYSGWFEILFAYLDATFSLSSGALAGTHTVRTAFAEIPDLGYRRGDLLYRTGEGFRWIDSATGEFAAVRPEHPLQLRWVAGYAGSGDGRGNQHIPPIFVAVQDSQKVHIPADTILANAWEFVVDFILRRGLIFRRSDPASMTRVSELLAAFDIRADRDNASSGSDGISSNFYAIRTPLDRPRPNSFKDSLGNWILPPPDSGAADP